MKFTDIPLAGLAENLALDEALLLHAESGGPEVLRLWEWPHPAVVLGAGGRLADDVHEEACRADGVPILRRSSGGGTVLLGAGCLVYSLILSFDRHDDLTDLHASYRHILGRILVGLQPHVPGGLAQHGISDLTFGDHKFSGSSQQRKRTHLLHHGTFLCGFDLARVASFLKMPPRQPEYRGGRSHLDFLTNIHLPAETLTRILREAWQADEPLASLPTDLLKQLLREKYESPDWIRRR